MREVSQVGIDLVKHFEGCRLSAYQDQKGIWTIGYGHTRGVSQGMTCTQADSDHWLAEDMAMAAAVITERVKAPLTQSQFDALTSLTFNIGAFRFTTSTLLKKLNAGDVAGAAAEFGKWIQAGTRVSAGLITRRAAERALFEEVS
jgi:lysozyme